jgi:hypothetical protein
MLIITLGTGSSAREKIISAVKRVEFISDKMSYVTLRGCWCDVIVLEVHAPTEDKSDDTNDSFYEEPERVLDEFPKYRMKILLGDFNAKVGREGIFEPVIGNESLYEISYGNRPGALSLGLKRPGREADHSPPSSAEVKNAWSYTSTPPICLHGVVLS